MNLPNKITITRIILSVLVMIILMLPFGSWISDWPVYTSIFGHEISALDLAYIIAGVLFLIASLTDKIDGYLARKNNEVTDLGKMLDAIADKILVNGVLIILAYQRAIPLVVPVVVITRDIIVDTCKMMSGNKGKVVAASSLGKIKTAFMMTGVTLTLFGNLPFELVHFDLALLLIVVATVLSVISGCDYYFKTKALLTKEK